MRAYEIPVRVSSDGRLELPESLMKLLPANEVVRVIVLVAEPDDTQEQRTWNHLAAEQFLAGYDDADSIYDRV
jgi:hypothetical protein